MREYRLFILLLLLILSLTFGTVFAQDEATEEPEVMEVVDNDDSGSTYIVQPNDTLFSIARRFSVNIDDLIAFNNIANPSRILVGDQIFIPALPGGGGVDSGIDIASPSATPVPETAPVSSIYMIQPGDNLFRVALRNNITVSRLMSMNPNIFNPNLVFVGQRINLPGVGSASSEISLNVAMSRGIEVFLGDDVSANTNDLLSLGVDWVKITVDWALVEPEQAVFDFVALDSAIAELEEANEDILIMLTLTDAPDWSRSSATELAMQQPTYGPPDDLDTFGIFAGEIASRYAGRVDAYEIWSQPNIRLNWMTTDVTLRSDGFPDAHLSETDYIDLLEVAYDAIKESDSDAMVITAGLAPTGIHDDYNAIRNDIFFEALLQQGAVNFSDGFGIHIDGFSNAPDARCCGTVNEDPEYDEVFQFFFADILDNYREIMNRNGVADLPLWVTRFGWGTTEGASGDGSGVEFVRLNSAQNQADYTVQAFSIGESRGDIAAMILYNLNGCAVSDTRACYYSLNNASGGVQPVLDLLSQADEGE